MKIRKHSIWYDKEYEEYVTILEDRTYREVMYSRFLVYSSLQYLTFTYDLEYIRENCILIFENREEEILYDN